MTEAEESRCPHCGGTGSIYDDDAGRWLSCEWCTAVTVDLDTLLADLKGLNAGLTEAADWMVEHAAELTPEQRLAAIDALRSVREAGLSLIKAVEER
jgi:hypothetical protein